MIAGRRVHLLILLTANIFLGSTCSVFSDAGKADAIRDQMQTAFVFIDSTLSEAEEFNTEFFSNTPNFELMKSDLDLLVPLDAKLVQAQEVVTHIQVLEQEMIFLNMPDWYSHSYATAVGDQIDKREQVVTQYQTIILKEKNFALAVTSFYDGLYKFYDATDAIDFLPPLDPANPEPLAQEVQRIQDEMSLATSSFNTAATYVNVEPFTRMRDSAVDFQQAINTLNQMVSLLEEMQQTTDPDELQVKTEQMDQLSYTLELLLTQFSAGLPTEYVNEQDHFTPTALEDFIAWRTVNLDSLVKEARSLLNEIKHVDAAANMIYNTER